MKTISLQAFPYIIYVCVYVYGSDGQPPYIYI